MDNLLFFMLLGTMLVGFSLLCKLMKDSTSNLRFEIKDATSNIRIDRKNRSLRSDQLYAEFVELLKARNRR